MKVRVYTLGCRLNQTEGEAIAQAFAAEGCDVVQDDMSADLYVVNTCTVTSKAEQKARRMIRKYASEPHAPVVVVTGCYAQMDGTDIAALAARIVVFPLDKKAALLALPRFMTPRIHSGDSPLDICREFAELVPAQLAALHAKSGGEGKEPSVFDYAPDTFLHNQRAYLKVQDGCDNACAFCRVHVARGKAVDLNADEVVRRVMHLERQGFHEVVLTGVNLTMYGYKGEGLGALVEKILEHIGSDMRIRLSSLEPDHVDGRLLDTLHDPRMQPYFHIPVQSANQKVLYRINRHYSVEHLAWVIDRLRDIKDDPCIAADIIAGLPAEYDAEFQETYDFLKNKGFARLHVFPFSPRPDTPLYQARDRVPESVRDERAARLRELSACLLKEYSARQEGREAEVILEQKKDGWWNGLTGNYLRARVEGSPQDARPGDLFKVVIGKTADNGSCIVRVLV
ncbi:tRNA (N(6)-L-threonylcarbamoyladenosine(37)-C(2))-methylthiotransferase MtaB [Parasphaerochaeta coccoides]|uniref:MiaB-like tRNA modifying enzyme n=1 Tax=Parasphaerochaeta coccoides (strain ATCC BAA-1237 / DSM 17374 / SPN1) TaxID=760011 RepID=F4GJG7_PARC1|nr:tRNA (N(6)-L-threonylcarbamoyladenosine(37)-C(2))-methylthiotransferase MtaB [Parasphaerochaeta coccoides]AEC02232.1 MiaB-like tRNA modifying enzyme [Parasphaerochaeta coccoides DSM 17374]